jgi:threonylcarbamoyladenosine tRNA methylthiotransferase CDKAL1
LLACGHEQVLREEDAEIMIINTCVVIQPTELKIMKRLRRLAQSGQELIIAGCLPAIKKDQLQHEFPQALLLAPSDYDGFAEIARERFGSTGQCDGAASSQLSGVLPISQGCLGNCTYCLTKKARGHLQSYPLNELLEKGKQLLGEGSREILVTAQDTGCYGLDIGTDLGALLNALVKLPGDFMVRVGMMNPDSLDHVIDGLIPAWNRPKVYKFLHLPVQSGSDQVLSVMGRGYKAASFEAQVARFRVVQPRMSLSTDIITGFPGETDDDHRASVELVRRVRPNIVNVTRFSSRPGTKAAKAKGQVPSWISKERSREMAKLRFELGEVYYSSFVGECARVLITEVGKKGSMVGRTEEYAPVAIPNISLIIGTWVDVEVVDHAATHLLGKIVDGMGPAKR